MKPTVKLRRRGRSFARLALAAAVGVAVTATPLVTSAAPTAAAAPATTAPAPAPKPGLSPAMAMGQLDKILAKADATPDQSSKIKAIIFDAVMSMGSQANTLKATAGMFGKSLMAPHVNRTDLEGARVSAVAEFDAFTKVMVKALGDAADVLTPEQRAKLAASVKAKS